MSVQQEQLIVELGNSLQWLPTSARIVAWCRLVTFMDGLPEGELADPILALLPYIGDVATHDFAAYHATLGKLVRMVPEKERGRVVVGLRDVAAKLPPAMRPLLSSAGGGGRMPTGLAPAQNDAPPSRRAAPGRPAAAGTAQGSSGPAHGSAPPPPKGPPIAPLVPPRGLSPRPPTGSP